MSIVILLKLASFSQIILVGTWAHLISQRVLQDYRKHKNHIMRAKKASCLDLSAVYKNIFPIDRESFNKELGFVIQESFT